MAVRGRFAVAAMGEPRVMVIRTSEPEQPADESVRNRVGRPFRTYQSTVTRFENPKGPRLVFLGSASPCLIPCGHALDAWAGVRVGLVGRVWLGG